MTPDNLPPCAGWEIWEGPEVEGVDGLGVKTLFVRRGESEEILRLVAGYARVWFCAQYYDWDVVCEILNRYECEVCVEVTPDTRFMLPDDIFQRAKLYFKTGLSLKLGDHVAIGAPFEEELFRVGDGAKVEAREYLQDKRIK